MNDLTIGILTPVGVLRDGFDPIIFGTDTDGVVDTDIDGNLVDTDGVVDTDTDGNLVDTVGVVDTDGILNNP